MTIYCQQCGAAMPASASFCSVCGAAIPVMQPLRGRPLMRPRVGRQIAGVCLGIAQANGWDVSAVRIVSALGLIFTSGLVGVAYLAAWVIIPEETPPLPGGYPPKI